MYYVDDKVFSMASEVSKYLIETTHDRLEDINVVQLTQHLNGLGTISGGNQLLFRYRIVSKYDDESNLV